MELRNLITAGAIALVLPVLLSSCKDDHVCTCTYTTPLGTNTERYILEDQTKPDAIDNCENYEKNSQWTTANCNL